MSLLEAIKSIAMRLSFGQLKDEIRDSMREHGVSDSMFFWAWQAATWTPQNLVCCSPMLSRSFKASCVVTPEYILYDHGQIGTWAD